jgi:hypothetical protein
MVMEMTFPPLNEYMHGAPRRSDFRALLSTAISRQANSVTSIAVIAAQRNVIGNVVRDDSVESRLHYFAGNTATVGANAAPHGSFYSGKASEFGGQTNYDQAVYQDGLINRKPVAVIPDLSDELASHPGQEKLRSI